MNIIKDLCRRLAKLGYRRSPRSCMARQAIRWPTIRKFRTSCAKIVSAGCPMPSAERLDACVPGRKPTAATPPGSGVTGFCWGGRITWLYAAHNPKVKAGVAWYGACSATPAR